jgi:hypothetical protein
VQLNWEFFLPEQRIFGNRTGNSLAQTGYRLRSREKSKVPRRVVVTSGLAGGREPARKMETLMTEASQKNRLFDGKCSIGTRCVIAAGSS